MLKKLSDDYLIDCYIKANSLGLEPYFIFLIEQELPKRGLSSIQSKMRELDKNIFSPTSCLNHI